MPTETRRFLDPEQRTGLNLYAKLFGSVTSPHSTGTIEPTEIGNGYYDFPGLDTVLDYTVQEEAVAGTQVATDAVLSTLTASNVALLPTANAISTQIANDITEASNNWDDALPALIPTIKSGARQALNGRWENVGTAEDRDDISVGDIP